MRGAKPGERRGGRKPGVLNKATTEIRSLAQAHGPDAIAELARLAKEAQSEQARISACNSLLDRAYGRTQAGQLIEFELLDVSTIDGLTKSLTDILKATAAGKITPSEAQAISAIIETQRKAIETAEVEDRLAQLEETIARNGR